MEDAQESMAMLLSLLSFESFYGGVMNLTYQEYLASYRNDFSFLYASALAEQGVKVVIYMPAWSARGLHQVEEGVFVRFLPLAAWYKPWHRFKLLSRTMYGRYLSSYANVRAFSRPLKRALKEDQVNVLYVQEYWTARFDYLVRSSKIPVIGSDHGGSRKRQLTLWKRQAFFRASAITCQTEEECADIRSFGGTPLLLQNGVDTTFFSPDHTLEREQTILIVARLTERQKRISDLLRALQQLPESWELQIAGTGPDEALLRRLAAELGVLDRVKFLGFVQDKTALRELYRRCGVYCMPSATEAVALAVLEAMSCGCAVVVTAIPAFRDLVRENETGCKVPVGEPGQLAEAIQKAWAGRERLGNAAREAVQHDHSIRAVARRLLSLMRSARHKAKPKSASTPMSLVD